MKSTWTWLGDHLALDFVNTVVCPDGTTRQELWDGPEAMEEWLEAEPESLPAPAAVSADDVDGLRRLRDHALELLDAAVREQELPGDSVEAINAAVVAAGTARVLTHRTRSSTVVTTSTDPLRELRGHLAAAVVDLLGREDLANLARCGAPGCGQYYHRSRPNQRWCSPGCGNRARVDRHRHRRLNGEQ